MIFVAMLLHAWHKDVHVMFETDCKKIQNAPREPFTSDRRSQIISQQPGSK